MGRRIGMAEVGWSVPQVAHHLARSDITVIRCCNQGLREISHTRLPSSGWDGQINNWEDNHVIRHWRAEAVAVLWDILTYVEPSLQSLSHTHSLSPLVEGYLISKRRLPMLPMICIHRRLRFKQCFNLTKMTVGTHRSLLNSIGANAIKFDFRLFTLTILY